MKVGEFIEWLKTQPQDAMVRVAEVKVNQFDEGQVDEVVFSDFNQPSIQADCYDGVLWLGGNEAK